MTDGPFFAYMAKRAARPPLDGVRRRHSHQVHFPSRPRRFILFPFLLPALPPPSQSTPEMATPVKPGGGVGDVDPELGEF